MHVLHSRFFLWQHALSLFYKRYPFVKIALFFALGIGCFFSWQFVLLTPLFMPKKALLPLMLMLLGLLHSHLNMGRLYFQVPMKGSGLIYITAAEKKQMATHAKVVIKGRMQAFVSEHGKHLGGFYFYSRQLKAPFKLKTGCQYLVNSCQIVPLGNDKVYLTISPQSPPIMEKAPSLFFKAKNWLKRWMRSYFLTPIRQPRTKMMFAALLLGEKPSESVSSFFKVCGMSHLLCISGLHLVLFFAACRRLLSIAFSKQRALMLAVTLISIYALALLPSSPSIGRAYLALIFYSFARFKQLPISSLNILALVFTLSLIIDPGQIVHIGFQLSYSATLALIWFLPFIQQKINGYLPKRDQKQTLMMPLTSRLGFIVLYYMKQLLAINVAVTLFCSPILLFHNLAPSPLSFFYNLLYPSIFAALILMSYTSALIMLFLPPLKGAILAILTRCFDSFFHLLIFFPKKLDVPLSLPMNSPLIAVFLMLVLFLIPLPSFLKKHHAALSSY